MWSNTTATASIRLHRYRYTPLHCAASHIRVRVRVRVMATIPGEKGATYKLLGHWVFFMGSIKGKSYPVAHLGLVVGCQVQRYSILIGKSGGAGGVGGDDNDVYRTRVVHKIYIPERKHLFEVILDSREWMYCHPKCVPWYGNDKVGRRIAVLWTAVYDNPEMRALAERKFPGAQRAYYEAYIVEPTKLNTDNIDHSTYRIVYSVDNSEQVRRLAPGQRDWCFLENGQITVDELAVITW